MVAVQMLAELEEVHNIIEYTWSKYLATLVFNMDVVGDRVQAAAGEAARHPGDVVAAAAGRQFNRHLGFWRIFGIIYR